MSLDSPQPLPSEWPDYTHHLRPLEKIIFWRCFEATNQSLMDTINHRSHAAWGHGKRALRTLPALSIMVARSVALLGLRLTNNLASALSRKDQRVTRLDRWIAYHTAEHSQGVNRQFYKVQDICASKTLLAQTLELTAPPSAPLLKAYQEALYRQLSDWVVLFYSFHLPAEMTSDKHLMKALSALKAEPPPSDFPEITQHLLQLGCSLPGDYTPVPGLSSFQDLSKLCWQSLIQNDPYEFSQERQDTMQQLFAQHIAEKEARVLREVTLVSSPSPSSQAPDGECLLKSAPRL